MTERPLLAADHIGSLVGPEVGTWLYDVANDRCFGCRTFSNLYGIPYEEATAGVHIQRLAEVLHPDDRAHARAKRLHMLEHGGLFIQEFRTVPGADGRYRWLLAIGRYEQDHAGRVTSGRGIVFETSNSHSTGDTSMLRLVDVSASELDQGAPIDRAIAHAIQVHQSIEVMPGPKRLILMPLVDALLIELGMVVSAQLRENEKQSRVLIN